MGDELVGGESGAGECGDADGEKQVPQLRFGMTKTGIRLGMTNTKDEEQVPQLRFGMTGTEVGKPLPRLGPGMTKAGGIRARVTRDGGTGWVALTRKQRGEMAEAAFLAKAASLGLRVSKPWGEGRYDLIVDNGKKLLRVQVKSAHRPGKENEYRIYARGCSMRVYDASEIDLLAAYVVPANAWYLFPVEEFLKYKSMRLYPVKRRKASKFEKFRENWEIMR